MRVWSLLTLSFCLSEASAEAAAFVCRVQCKSGGEPVFIDQTDRGGVYSMPGFCGLQRFNIATKKAFEKAYVEVGTQTHKRFAPYIHKPASIPEAERIFEIAHDAVDIRCMWSKTISSNEIIEKMGGKPKPIDKPPVVCKKPEAATPAQELKALEKVFDRIKLDMLTVRTLTSSPISPQLITVPKPAVAPPARDPELEDPTLLQADIDALKAEKAKLEKEIEDLLKERPPKDNSFTINPREDERPLVFIVDVSSSMRGDNRAATMKLLRETIAKLPPSRKFNILTMISPGASGFQNPNILRPAGADTEHSIANAWIDQYVAPVEIPATILFIKHSNKWSIFNLTPKFM